MSTPVSARADRPAYLDQPDWWRSAVTYQIYPRSFADGNGDGTGDLTGVIAKLPHLVALGVDAVWFNPWYPSPLNDGGYDVADYRGIHPDFGTLEQADELITLVHEAGMKILIDLVPNHCSDQHPWFQAALAAGPGSPERDRFIFRDGKGPNSEEPPTNWTAMFGGSTWQRVIGPDGKPEQFYLHLFDPTQPDFNWENPEVIAEFDDILRFWFDRGIDGFRIDVADSMSKDLEFPDMPIDPRTGIGTLEKYEGSPIFDHPGVHAIHRRWRRIADEYADSDLGPRVFVSEAWLTPAPRLAQYVRPDELHMTFNFDALSCAWEADSQRRVIDATRSAMAEVGAPCTWVLANHDTIRPVTRYGKPVSGRRHTDDGLDPETDLLPQELEAMPTDVELGRRRARAAALLELALPGGAYIYQGDELGLAEVEDLPAEALQDPTWERSGHVVRGRDGCRVPLPWSGEATPYGFGGTPWLPQPDGWAPLTAAAQAEDRTSTLALYRRALEIRRSHPALGDGEMTWDESAPEVLSFSRDPGFRCIVNFGADPVSLPTDAEVLITSCEVFDNQLAPDQAVWLKV
ncbi:glycoside hydrolase family 13 protein [Propionibacteriaceae bacterium Y1700]|uniref:glycoside hydrolase family 13 protein n=1 Tax=Microlunatus sp. Y1700 TaxID=3418487 RepID=UPI003DA7A320